MIPNDDDKDSPAERTVVWVLFACFVLILVGGVVGHCLGWSAPPAAPAEDGKGPKVISVEEVDDVEAAVELPPKGKQSKEDRAPPPKKTKAAEKQKPTPRSLKLDEVVKPTSKEKSPTAPQKSANASRDRGGGMQARSDSMAARKLAAEQKSIGRGNASRGASFGSSPRK